MLRQTVFAISVVAGVAVWLMSAPAFREVTVEALAQQPPPQQRPQEVTLDLLARGAQPKLAIPDFAVAGDDAELRSVAATVADVLWRDLRFEQEFYLIDRKESAKIPAADSPETLAYDRWFELGADFVVMGLVRKAGSEFEIDIRLIGVRGEMRGKQGFGSKYGQCSFKNPRYCAHYIADDMHKKIRGLDGVARTKIAFTSDRDASRLADRPLADAAQSKEIYISDYDGANQYRVTANRSLNLGPAWGPDLRTLAYVSYVTRFPDIYVANIHEARPPARPAAGDTRVHNFLPAISPDGSKVAFASPRDGSMDIWVVNRDGSGLKNLTPNTRKSDENGPAWSPTGTQIAFTSDRTGTNQIWAMGADGFGAERLTSDLHCDRPAWSSRGYIAYTYGSGPGHEIAFIDLSTRKVTILTDGVGTNGSPTVAPNGRHVAFVTTRWGKNHVAIINVKGEANNMTRVTESGNNTYPNWSPSPGK